MSYGGYRPFGAVEKVYRMALPESPERASMVSLDYIHALVRDGRQDPVLRERALRIIREARVREKDRLGAIMAVHRWVQANLPYQYDPTNTEMLTQARVILAMIESGEAGLDCDDMVILEHSLLNSIGIETRSVILKADPRDRSQWSHIYLEAFDGSRWIPLDPIMKDKPPGWAPPRFYDKRAVPIGDGPAFPPSPGTALPRGMSVESYEPSGSFFGGAVGISGWRGFGRYSDYGQVTVVTSGGATVTLTPQQWASLTPQQQQAYRQMAAQQQAATRETLERRAAIEQVRELETHPGKIPELQNQLRKLIEELEREIDIDRMIASVLELMQFVSSWVPGFIEQAERAGHRIEKKLKYLETVDRIVKAIVIVLEALGTVTAGITTVIAIAVSAANAAYQIRSIGQIMKGSASSTIRAVGIRLDEIAATLELGSEVIVALNNAKYALESWKAEVGLEPDIVAAAMVEDRKIPVVPLAVAAGVAALLAVGAAV